MTEIQIYQDGPTHKTTSKNVADVFGKTHRDVMRDLNRMDCSPEFRARNFAQSSYVSEQNKTLPCVEMTKDGFTFLCMGYRGKKAAQFKEAYIAEFNRMAHCLHSISDRVAKLELDRRTITEKGKEWSEIGHEIRRAKKQHRFNEDQLLADVQMRISFD